MVVVHGGHAHALQSPLFPPLSAPIIARFGLRGAYVLPAIAFIALCLLLEVIRQHVMPDASPLALAGLAHRGDPLLFYALSPGNTRQRWRCWPAGPRPWRRHNRAGRGWPSRAAPLVGAGVLLRPEGLWYAVGLLFTLARPALAGIRERRRVPAARLWRGEPPALWQPARRPRIRGARTHRRRFWVRALEPRAGMAVAGIRPRMGGPAARRRRLGAGCRSRGICGRGN